MVVNDSLEAALTDWFILGMHTGMRKSEWWQDRNILQKTGDVMKNRDGSSSAFVLDDFIFEHLAGFRCNNTRTSHLQSASLVKICWRFQKNGNNGEVLSYIINAKNPARCPIRAALQIRARGIHLGAPQSSHCSFQKFYKSITIHRWFPRYQYASIFSYPSIQHQQTKLTCQIYYSFP